MVTNEITEISKLHCFKDYIIWLENNDLHFRAELFWKRELKGFNKPTELPKNEGYKKYVNNKEMTTTMNENIIFSNNTINSIKYIIKKYKLTMNTLIQGIWSIILSMFNIDNNFDILFGATVSGRSVASIDIIGLVYDWAIY